MSRVYNALTGSARPAAAPTPALPDDGAWENSEEAPFIEIGAPTGPIFFSPPSAAVAASIPPAPAPTTRIEKGAVPNKPPEPSEAARTFPRLVPTTGAPAYLSVRFHEIAGPTHNRGAGPDPSLVALHHPEHPVSEEYRVLRDEIRKQLPELTPHVLYLSAGAPEAGTTTVLTNLAITLAQDGKARVGIVDANLNRPAVAAKLALKPAPGLREVVAGSVPLAWALQPSPLPTLQVLACGEATDRHSQSVGREFPRLLTQLRQWFDWVLVDGGVWGESSDREAAAPAADAVYLVTREADACRSEFTSLRGWVAETGGLLRGYIATRV